MQQISSCVKLLSLALGLLAFAGCSQRDGHLVEQRNLTATTDSAPHANETTRGERQISRPYLGGDCPMTILQLELLARGTNLVYVAIEPGKNVPAYVDGQARELYVWKDARTTEIPGLGPISAPATGDIKDFAGYRVIEYRPPLRFLRALDGSAQLGYFEPVNKTFYRWRKKITGPHLARKRGFIEVVPSSEEGAEYIRHVVDIDAPPPDEGR